MKSKRKTLTQPEELREFALSFPGAYEAFPWGERVAKVGKKVFVFLGHEEAAKAAATTAKKQHIGEVGGFGLSVKLPLSHKEALSAPFTEPTGYGLGTKGWVSASFERGERAPLEQLKAWIEESYRAIAPKKLLRQLDEAPET